MDIPRTTRCDAIAPMLAPYVDGEARQPDREIVEAHLSGCPACASRVSAERAVRSVLHTRRAALTRLAPASLRLRCVPRGPRPFALRQWVPLSLAATLLLAVGGAFLYTLNHRAEALAMSITADHVKCFQLADMNASADPAQIAADWERAHGWRVTVMPGQPSLGIRLVGIRRCLSTEGQTAHLLYTCEGRPLSVFVWRAADLPARDVEVFGHKAVIWSSPDRMYAVVGTESAERMSRVAACVRQSAQ